MLILHDHITYGFVLKSTQSQRTLCEYKRLLTHDSLVVFSGNASSRTDTHIHIYEDPNGIFFFLQLNALLTAVLRIFISKNTHKYIGNVELQVPSMI